MDIGDSWIHPFYDGHSILNLPSSICQWLGAPLLGAGALSSEITSFLPDDFRVVIVILIDALSFQRLTRWIKEGDLPAWRSLSQRGILHPITSVVPSTTSAALTSIWTGRSPFEHGITGYEMWMKEYGIVTNTILQMPITFKSDLGALERTGFSPEKAIPFPTLGSHLRTHGIRSYALEHQSIAYSGLSRMLLKETEILAFNSAADLWVNLRNLLEAKTANKTLDKTTDKTADKTAQRMFVWVYWSEVDHFGHVYGPDDERTAAEFTIFSRAMQDLFLNRLSSEAGADTLLLLTADHGHLTTQPDPHYDLTHHPNLTRRLHIMPTGENRLVYLYIRPGQTEAVREYIDRAWPGQFLQLDSGYAIENGLFGSGDPHTNLGDRVGDVILLARNDAYLWWADKENRMVGRHGGLHPEEMLVPLLAAKL